MARILILDDMQARHEVLARRYPEADRVHVLTFAEALGALSTGRFDLMLLDHDLGEERTGYDVALEIAALPPERRPREAVVHSHNPGGAERMRAVLLDAGIPARLEPFSSSSRPRPVSASWLEEQAAHERILALLEACRLLPGEIGIESLLANLRVAGGSKVEAICVLYRLRGLRLEEGASLVDGSETWRDQRAADASSREALMAAARELCDVDKRP